MEESGLLLVDKPYGWTSFDVVNKVRFMIKSVSGKKMKTGHTGTLDPLATGLLVLCYGKATKKIEEYTGLDKEYVTTMVFGATTASFDKEQPVEGHFETEHITQELILKTIPEFIGNIMQIPPIHSAKWVNGRRAYEYARAGKEAIMEARETVVHSFELLDFSPPKATFRIHCGKGFYIRSLARDFSAAINSGAYIDELIRTRI
ncbi:MAG: tRNA pseudouridine(55) synthase TruB, partial [Bacteroidetes bacterium HGW-Bacteroidetes-21]